MFTQEYAISPDFVMDDESIEKLIEKLNTQGYEIEDKNQFAFALRLVLPEPSFGKFGENNYVEDIGFDVVDGEIHVDSTFNIICGSTFMKNILATGLSEEEIVEIYNEQLGAEADKGVSSIDEIDTANAAHNFEGVNIYFVFDTNALLESPNSIIAAKPDLVEYETRGDSLGAFSSGIMSVADEMSYEIEDRMGYNPINGLYLSFIEDMMQGARVDVVLQIK